MRAAVRNVAKYIPTAIISGRSREKVFGNILPYQLFLEFFVGYSFFLGCTL